VSIAKARGQREGRQKGTTKVKRRPKESWQGAGEPKRARNGGAEGVLTESAWRSGGDARTIREGDGGAGSQSEAGGRPRLYAEGRGRQTQTRGQQEG